ncbi:MAG: xanthine dehydrogenase subunit D [Candidatus Nephthysia bennettiae]|uniref:Molybdopterin-dependent oxidoreductase n=1 Tax=Candidatus Nephthysia bennettiae TaxID=3127016 RepID=A0A934K899_9BACT|nr:molybdopterin-dependent oxidoreductase [Candidatus Dormibacteraeota bacterium]PZR90980.1 MAG: xanthine dehydrogenase subunit D [Candidatus Dormibacteraeota bacterium]
MPEHPRGVGASIPRPDAPAKVRGSFQFASDLVAPGMLFGRTLRSPHPRALLRSLDTSAAERMPGVRAVLTAADVAGSLHYGVHGEADQPVLVPVGAEVRYAGEPVAIVAAEHPEQALQATRAIRAGYEEQQPLTDPVEALRRGESLRTLVIRRGDVRAEAEVVVEGYYEVGQQDQAPLGPEAGLAVPGADGREVDLWIATQALHVDLGQVAACLGLPRDRVRLRLAGVGGAFGAREDLSVQVHACMLALRTGRPVRMSYGREESFVGHVHRHPARMWYTHGAGRDGHLVFVRATIVLDGGAYASTSAAVTANAACFAAGPYRVPNALIWCGAARTNQVPNGAMRGFGAVQSCFGHESQMDLLAARLGIDPVELRLRNALRPGDRIITGQPLRGAAPVEELIRRCAELPAPPQTFEPMALPGGAGNLSERHHVRRGTGFAIGYKNIAYSEGSDDSVTARVRLERRDGEAVAVVKTAAAEVGQGLVTVLEQVVRTELGVESVELEPADTLVGDGGSSSASRQTWMAGGAVREASRLVREEVLRRAGPPGQGLAGGQVMDEEGSPLAPLALLLDQPVEREFEHHHRPTSSLDQDGQGEAHVSFMFVAQRATVDVDPEAGATRVVQVATAQDVGRAINPLQVHGQIEGAVAQGVGLATMEEIQARDGLILNASFTDYLLPTSLDMPAVESTLVEEAEPEAPYGAKGVGEPPLIASPVAIAAAMRQATGRRLRRLPVRPDELAGLSETRPQRWIEPGTAP